MKKASDEICIKIPTIGSISALPCRMLNVEVHAQVEGEYYVEWTTVVGLLSVVQYEYHHHYDAPIGMTYEALQDAGWKASSSEPFLEVFPVVIGIKEDEEPLLVKADPKCYMSFLMACDWTPDKDKEKVINEIRRRFQSVHQVLPTWCTVDRNGSEI